MSTDLQTLNTNQALQEWSARIKECRNSGMTVRNWCSEQGIRTQTFYYWQKKLFNMVANQNHPEFAEISMPAEKYASETSAVAKVRINGFEVDVPKGSDTAELTRLFLVLKQC